MFEVKRGEKVEVHKLSCIDAGRVFVPMKGKDPARVVEVNDIRGENTRVYVDPIGKKVYFVG
jgi:hypothetical protein